MCKETEKFFIFESDRHGFNNPDPVWEHEILDIVVTGDSFAQGSCVQDEEGFVSLLRKEYPATINLGMAANGPLHMLAALKEYTATLNPSVVLWTYTEDNDVLTDISEEWRSPLLLNYMKTNFSQDLLNKRTILDQRLKSFLSRKKDRLDMFPAPLPPVYRNYTPKILSNIQSYIYFRNIRDRLNMAIGRSSKWVQRFGQVLEHGRQFAENRGAKFYLIYLPSKRRYTNFTGLLFQNIMRERILSLVNDRLNIPIIDLVPVFDALEDPLVLFLDHYTVTGNRLVADTILAELNKR